MTVRTLNFASATIGGSRVEFRQGRLMLRTNDAGIREWDATGIVGGVVSSLGRLGDGTDIRVEFDAGHIGVMAGQAFLDISITTSPAGARTVVRLRGTGPLEGWT